MLKAEIKNKIKQLLKEKKVNKAELSRSLGKDKTFINSIICGKNSFFSLEHIEKICTALDYPVAKLFEDGVNSPEEQILSALGQITQNPADPIEWALVEIFRGLSPKHKGKLVGVAEDLRLAEAIPPKVSKKASAAA